LKRCTACGELKPLEEFYRAAGMRDGHRNDCKVCNLAAKHDRHAANPEPARERAKRWARENPERYQRRMEEYARSGKKAEKDRASYIKRTFGLTPAEYDALFAAQDGLCAICGTRAAVHIDHDHATGLIRGALCFGCNGGLGQFCDDPDLLRRAIDYLERHRAS
jgi:Recombination endonuclease VII